MKEPYHSQYEQQLWSSKFADL